MKALVISTEFPPGPGGIGNHAYELVKHLILFGWQVEVLTRQDHVSPDNIKSFNQKQEFKITSLRKGNYLSRFFLIREMTKKFKPDILIASGSRTVWLAAFVTRFIRLPWVAIGHGGEFGFHDFLRRAITRWSFQMASGVVCVSQYTQDRMKQMGIKPKNVCVITNAANAEIFKILTKDAMSDFKKNNDSILFTAGQVSERKGQDIVIRALPAILTKYPKVQYLMAGLPTKKEAFLNLAKKLGVEEHVKFLGVVGTDTLVKLYNACDLYVMVSRHSQDGDFEGYGIAAIEAALCGKPAIVSDNSGLAEAVLHEKTGWVIPENDSAALSKVVCRLLSDDRLRIKLGEEALVRAQREQTWKSVVKKYDAYLCSVVQEFKT